MNPTVRLWPILFKHRYEVSFFGPGYVSEKVLKLGLKNFIRMKGPFDFIVASVHLYYNTLSDVDVVHQEKVYRKSYIIKFDIKKALKRNYQLFNEFIDSEAKKVIPLFGFDFYNMRQSNLDLFQSLDTFFIALGNEFIRHTDELTFLKDESFGIHANNRWYDFVNENAHRIISLPAFVGEEEFSWLPLSERQFEWSVPGVNYRARKIAKKKLDDGRIHWRGRLLPHVVSGFTKFKLGSFTNPLVKTNFNYYFRNLIESTKYCYTCGSGLNYPVRKFFEIPALGSVLVCLPCNGFKDLGFQDGVNALCRIPEEILNVPKFLQRNTEMAQEIASAGRELIWQRHTTYARSKQIYACLSAIAEGTFQGSFWDGGDFCILKKKPDGKSQTVKVTI